MSHIHEALRRAESEELAPYSEAETTAMVSWQQLSLVLLLQKHARLFAGVSLTFFLLAAIIVLTLPKKYEAEMKLLVKNERQDLVVSPESNVSTVHSSEPSETQINSEIELLRSTDVLRKVALQSGLSKPESGTVQAAGEVSPVSLDKALQGLQHDITITAVKKSDIIDVTYTSKNPEVASKVLKSLADTYLMAHLNVHANPGTFAFFDQQAKAYQDRLAESEVEVKKFREENSTLGRPDQNDVLASRSTEAQTELEHVDAEIADYKQRIAQSEQSINALTPRVLTQQRVVPESQLVQTLGQALVQLQNHRTELLLKFNPDDPFIQEVDKQIADTTAAINQARAQKSEENASDINPIRQNTEKELVASQVALSGLQARRDTLAATAGDYQHKMYGLAGSSVQQEALERQLKENEENYLLYQKKREEARIAESLDRERITNVAVIQAPTTPLQPASPKVKLDLILSLICALFVGAVAILLAEYLEPKPKVTFSPTRAIAAAS